MNDINELLLIDVFGEFVSNSIVAMGTNCAVET